MKALLIVSLVLSLSACKKEPASAVADASTEAVSAPVVALDASAPAPVAPAVVAAPEAAPVAPSAPVVADPVDAGH